LGYARAFVQRGEEIHFEASEIETFEAENRSLIQQRQTETDPEDSRRRRYQMQILEDIKSRALASANSVDG